MHATSPHDLRSRLPPGLATAPAAFLDERVRPDFRDTFGYLAKQSQDIATAVTRVRLTTLDLSSHDLDNVQSFRVLVAELNALQLTGEARGLVNDPQRSPRLALIRRLLEAGKLEVRSAPLGGWSPDFTAFGDADGPFAVITGFHWFERPYPHRGPALGTVHGAEAARISARRHLELWDAAHDVGPAVWNILSRAERHARMVAAVSS